MESTYSKLCWTFCWQKSGQSVKLAQYYSSAAWGVPYWTLHMGMHQEVGNLEKLNVWAQISVYSSWGKWDAVCSWATQQFQSWWIRWRSYFSCSLLYLIILGQVLANLLITACKYWFWNRPRGGNCVIRAWRGWRPSYDSRNPPHPQLITAIVPQEE